MIKCLTDYLSIFVDRIAEMFKYRVIRNDCRDFNNLSYTIHLR